MQEFDNLNNGNSNFGLPRQDAFTIKPPALLPMSQQIPGLTPYGRQEMHRIQCGLPPGLTPYAMSLPGIRPL